MNPFSNRLIYEKVFFRDAATLEFYANEKIAISCLNNKSAKEDFAFLCGMPIRRSIQYGFDEDGVVDFFPFFSAASKLLRGKNLNHWQSVDGLNVVVFQVARPAVSNTIQVFHPYS
jgi:hypothetical protein